MCDIIDLTRKVHFQPEPMHELSNTHDSLPLRAMFVYALCLTFKRDLQGFVNTKQGKGAFCTSRRQRVFVTKDRMESVSQESKKSSWTVA